MCPLGEEHTAALLPIVEAHPGLEILTAWRGEPSETAFHMFLLSKPLAKDICSSRGS